MQQIECIIRTISQADKQEVSSSLHSRWGAVNVVSRGTIYRPDKLPGFGVYHNYELIGLVTYHIKDGESEIITLDSLLEKQGIGAKLVNCVIEIARVNGCKRVWLVTTNDNINAIRFYQKRGFTMMRLHVNAIEASRRLKPEIPLIGNFDIPIRHELEFEMQL